MSTSRASAKDILTLDKNWVPHSWIPTEEAIILEAKDLVIEHLGSKVTVYHGGKNRMTGLQSTLETSSIIVIDGSAEGRKYRDPALTNPALFQRDRFLCAYCGHVYSSGELTRDHYHPVSKGGKDVWQNVVTACRDCNSMKSNILPGQKLPFGMIGPQGTSKMDPLYLPYAPCKAEHLIMKNRKLKFDQMEFLLSRISNKNSRAFEYAKDVFGDKFTNLS